VLSPLSPVEAMELLLSRLSKAKSNAEFLSSMQGPSWDRAAARLIIVRTAGTRAGLLTARAPRAAPRFRHS